MFYISIKFEVITTNTFGLGEVQSLMTFITIKISHMFRVKLRFSVYVMKCLRTRVLVIHYLKFQGV